MHSYETMGKFACVKWMVVVRNYSTNTIMEKKQTEGEGGGGVLEISGVN